MVLRHHLLDPGLIGRAQRLTLVEAIEQLVEAIVTLDGGQLLLVNTIVEDPEYLNAPYIVSPHFKKEPDGSKWAPTPCSATW